MFPPLPHSLDGFHPLVVHFPIGVLLAAPLLVVLGLIVRKHKQGFLLSALAMMVVGTAFAWFAVASGEAAEELVDQSQNPALASVLAEHGELGETARNIFTILTVLLAAIIFAPVVIRKPIRPAILLGATIVFLVLYAAGALVLANAGHAGGRLVHEFGVRAMADTPKSAPDGEKHEEKK
jgi:uncharacterized membrane protein